MSPDDPGDDTSISDLLAEYLRTALAWDALQGDARRSNVEFDRLQEVQLRLRESEAGRAGVAGFTRHVSAGVRLCAASHALAWDPGLAVPVLEALEASTGLHAMSAKYTLRSFRSGTLNLDWQPS